MIIHFADTRGKADHGWLKSRHTFSFADYYDPARMRFGTLRVINDDCVEAGMGFGIHPHRDMEIISIPLEGSLQHQDSEGHQRIISKGEVQIMSAGSGIRHSEKNASQTEQVKFLQVWVVPKKLGIPPRYDQKNFMQNTKPNKFLTVVSPDGREGSIMINQDAFFSLGHLGQGEPSIYQKKQMGNGLYIFIISGEVFVDGKEFHTRDGIGMENFQSVRFEAKNSAEVLLMEVPL
jgi:redox-sensitive bicupin YhaK (pirin superfamily)